MPSTGQTPPPLPPPNPAERAQATMPSTQPVAQPAVHRPAAGPKRAKQPRPRAGTPDKSFTQGFGTGMGVALGVGVVLMALSLVSTLALVVLTRAAASTTSQPATAHVWGPANASNTVLALNISGAILGAGGGNIFSVGTYGYEIADQIDALGADDYAGVVLLMDTPGGSIYGSRAIADSVIRYQERTGKKVVAFVQSMSASGGMYSMASADHIIADHGTFIGSIGVIFGPFSRYKQVTGLTGNLLESGVETAGGIEQTYLTRGTGKDFGNPFRDMTAEELAVYTAGMDREYEQFVDFVSEHRGIAAETIKDDLGAFMFDPLTAVDKGLVDEVAGHNDAFKSAATQFGVDPEDTKLVSPAMPSTLSQLLGAQARVPGHNLPLSVGSGVQATDQICVGAPTVLAFAGDFQAVCGP